MNDMKVKNLIPIVILVILFFFPLATKLLPGQIKVPRSGQETDKGSYVNESSTNIQKEPWFINANTKFLSKKDTGTTDIVIVDGKTNLPSGTSLSFSWMGHLPSLGEVQIENGLFSFRSNIPTSKPGEYSMFIILFPLNQYSLEAIKVIGRNGENLDQFGSSTGKVRYETLPPAWQYILSQEIKVKIPS